MNIPKTKSFIINHFGLPINSNVVLYRGYKDCIGIFIEDANPTHLKTIWGIRKNKVAHQKGNKYIRIGKVILPSIFIDFNYFNDLYILVMPLLTFYQVFALISWCLYFFGVCYIMFFIALKVYK